VVQGYDCNDGDLVSLSIVIQGGVYSDDNHGNFTVKVAHEYASMPAVKKVIVSTWEGEDLDKSDFKNEKIRLLKNERPENNGPGNMNMQIISSLNGVSACDDGLVLKTRSDQYLYEDSLKKWLDHYEAHKHENTLRYTDGTQQKSKVFLIGNNKRFPFHPQDHFFLGDKQDVTRVFDVPLWNEPAWTWKDAPINFKEKLRPNIYLGINYYKQFFPEVEKYLERPDNYLVDDSPLKQEVMDFYTPIRESIFKPLPRIEMWWAKHNSGYWYSYEKEGEYYAD
jgi:hypothetical protein